MNDLDSSDLDPDEYDFALVYLPSHLQMEVFSDRPVLHQLRKVMKSSKKVASVSRTAPESQDVPPDLEFRGSEHRSMPLLRHTGDDSAVLREYQVRIIRIMEKFDGLTAPSYPQSVAILPHALKRAREEVTRISETSFIKPKSKRRKLSLSSKLKPFSTPSTSRILPVATFSTSTPSATKEASNEADPKGTITAENNAASAQTNPKNTNILDCKFSDDEDNQSLNIHIPFLKSPLATIKDKRKDTSVTEADAAERVECSLSGEVVVPSALLSCLDSSKRKHKKASKKKDEFELIQVKSESVVQDEVEDAVTPGKRKKKSRKSRDNDDIQVHNTNGNHSSDISSTKKSKKRKFHEVSDVDSPDKINRRVSSIYDTKLPTDIDCLFPDDGNVSLNNPLLLHNTNGEKHKHVKKSNKAKSADLPLIKDDSTVSRKHKKSRRSHPDETDISNKT